MLRFARWLILTLNVGNWLAVGFFALMAISLILEIPPAADRVARAALPGKAETMKQLVTMILVIGIVTGAAVDQIFRRLIHILDTVAEGQPFAAANGARLRVMAWCLLAIQLLDGGFAFAVRGINQAVRHAPFSWGPSATGWIAVLLLFVLAQVFKQGTALQDDLVGTV